MNSKDFMFFFFFFKQKTAYEIVDCDWSSDVCSSDLLVVPVMVGQGDAAATGDRWQTLSLHATVWNRWQTAISNRRQPAEADTKV